MSIVQIKDQAHMEALLGETQEFNLPEIGEVITGTIVNVGKSQVVVDLDNAAMGIIRGDEAQDSANTLKTIKVGDPITATIIAHENTQGYVVLSLRRASQGKTWERFMDSYDNGSKIFVTVREANKGGLLVEEDGIRGFIPVSQLSPENYPRVAGGNTARILQKLESLINTKLEVKVINVDESEGRMILSEREAQKEARGAILQTLEEGKVIKGVISGVVDFGLFVNYNGVEGLVHISEIDWGHVSNPADYGSAGDEVEVLVIGVDGEKVSFSIKRLTPDPWIIAIKKYKLGEKVKGTVNKVADYGAFVKLEEAISGLVHVTELSDDTENPVPSEIVSIGAKVDCTIINIDEKKHELGLSLRTKSRKIDEALGILPKEEAGEKKEEKKEVEEKKEEK